MNTIDVVVVGAGVTGLASALAIAGHGMSVCLIERHGRAGLDTSTRNSGVIHAGIYYPADSLKTRLCIEGRRLLYDFCEQQGIPYGRTGKIIVAHDESEIGELEKLHARGASNGVERLCLVDRTFIESREPNVHAVAALYSPETGIVDAERLVRALLRVAVAANVVFLPATALAGADVVDDGVRVRTAREVIVARQVVNAAGLYADEVSRLLGGEAFTIYPCRGEYVELSPSKRSMVNGLVYPVPHRAGHSLGVHLLKTTDGAVWLGPTATYQARKDDYESNRLPLEAFLEPAQRLLPRVTREDLRMAGSGIRPKLHPPSESFADFLIRRDRVNPRIVHAAGIESPGLTACLATGRMVAGIVAEAT
jgi:L-2-hydroxyglutarate oxidase LhgO